MTKPINSLAKTMIDLSALISCCHNLIIDISIVTLNYAYRLQYRNSKTSV